MSLIHRRKATLAAKAAMPANPALAAPAPGSIPRSGSRSFDEALRKAAKERRASESDEASEQSRQVRLRLAALGSRLTLPVARKALGLLEGEHQSNQAGNGFDYLDLRDYQPGDEARLIEWNASARLGRPIVVNKRRDVTSTVWLLLDTGEQMYASSSSGERQIDVAANVLRMIALLSLRRGDEISLVLANAAQVSRTPFSGGYAEFDRLLREKIAAAPRARSDVAALLAYARRVETRGALIVLSTGEHALTAQASKSISIISQEHPLFFAVTKSVNPFDRTSGEVRDARSGRLMPAFLRTPEASHEYESRRDAAASSLRLDLERHGDTLLWSGSSQGMLAGFVRLVRASRFGVRRDATSMLRGQATGAGVGVSAGAGKAVR